MDKSLIEDAIQKGLSLREVAKSLNVTLSKLYYYIEKYEIKIRSKSAAQKSFIEKNGHQRTGHKHNSSSKEKISDTIAKFWDGPQGNYQKERITKQRRAEWESKSNKEKRIKINQLKNSVKPKAGQLSKFGKFLAKFLEDQKINVLLGQKLVLNHISDIILTKEKIVIELIPPMYVFGKDAEQKLCEYYIKIRGELDKLGYKLLIIEQVSTSISRCRCVKILTEINTLDKFKVIQS